MSSAVSAASPGSLSTGTTATLSMFCTGCAPAVFIATVSAPPRCDLVNVVHLWNLDSLLSQPQSRLGCCCRQRRSDRSLRSGDVSEVRLVQASHVPHDGMRVHPLWVRSFHPLWERSFHPLWVGFFFTSSSLLCLKLLGTSRRSRLSVAPCTTLSWRSMSCFVCSPTHVP